ncbi:hypothetical protein HY639_03535 [Candidatus Woesearchaeota archaeon]|nr:hypothetical protein [Candidatus Woesearchaeota archaeon]
MEKQFLLAACKKLAHEKQKLDALHESLKQELVEVQKLDAKIHSALTRKALSRVKTLLQEEERKVRSQCASLVAHEKQLKRHFTHDKHQLLRHERERVSLTRRGILVL